MFGLLLLFAGGLFVAVKGLETAKENAAAKANGTMPTDTGSGTKVDADTGLPSGPPPGWPATGPTMDQCELVMGALSSKMGKDVAKTFIQNALTATDENWAIIKGTLMKGDVESRKVADCLENTRAMLKFMINKGEVPPTAGPATSVSTFSAFPKIANPKGSIFPTDE